MINKMDDSLISKKATYARVITQDDIQNFKEQLISEEKSSNTVEKYVRDVSAFKSHSQSIAITKEVAVAYKKKLLAESYAIQSINSMLAAINAFFSFKGWGDCKVKAIKCQRQIFCREDRELSKEEYIRLVNAAQKNGNKRLDLLLQTICSTGIRVSELQFITVNAVKQGEASVCIKGKHRTVFIVRALQKKLLKYAAERGITSGIIFKTRSGKPMDRSNIWREMKDLCLCANIDPKKVFPHNLRHLFARIFYGLERDIAKLADVLGHSSINTTRIYIVTSGREHREFLEKMDLTVKLKKRLKSKALIT